jgi:programmed cell death protein 5
MEDLVATTSQSTPNPNGGPGNDKEGDANRAQEEQMRRDLLTTVLDTAARERRICSSFFHTQILVAHSCPVSRIALVSPDRSKQIETILLRMAQSGQLRNRVSEEQLIDLLNQVNFYLAPIGYNLIKSSQMEQAEGKTTVQKSTIVVSSSCCLPRPRFDSRIVSP